MNLKINRQQFDEVMSDLRSMFGDKDLSKMELQAWWNAFKNYDFHTVKAVIAKYMETTTEAYFPKPGRIKAIFPKDGETVKTYIMPDKYLRDPSKTKHRYFPEDIKPMTDWELNDFYNENPNWTALKLLSGMRYAPYYLWPTKEDLLVLIPGLDHDLLIKDKKSGKFGSLKKGQLSIYFEKTVPVQAEYDDLPPF